LVHGTAHKGTGRDRTEPKQHELRGWFFTTHIFETLHPKLFKMYQQSAIKLQHQDC
jgi:hypothetical protein